LVNALSNAQKYSPAGSPIQIQARQAPHEGASWAVVSVTDRGMGMTPEQTARAFERFYRADPSGHVLGAGLGLAIIQEMMARHGGRVELQSEAGVGTQINLWLPLLPTSEVAPEQQPAVQAELTS
jgi:signal transduction histidine kinase